MSPRQRRRWKSRKSRLPSRKMRIVSTGTSYFGKANSSDCVLYERSVAKTAVTTNDAAPCSSRTPFRTPPQSQSLPKYSVKITFCECFPSSCPTGPCVVSRRGPYVSLTRGCVMMTLVVNELVVKSRSQGLPAKIVTEKGYYFSSSTNPLILLHFLLVGA